MSSTEEMLEALLDGEPTSVVPRSRAEQYLKNCCEGCGTEGLPKPISRLDKLYYRLAGKLAGGGGESKVKITNADHLFYGGARLENADNFDLSEITSAVSVCGGAALMEKVPEGMNFKNCSSIKGAFDACNALTEVDIDATNVTKADGAFANCKALKKIVLRNSSKLTSVNKMLTQCNSLQWLEADFSSLSSFGDMTWNFFNSALSTIIFHGSLQIPFNFTTANITAESAISIITAMVDYTGTDNEFVHTQNFHSKTKRALEALGATSPNGNTWLEYVYDKGWNYA